MKNNLPAAQLWIGPYEHLNNKTTVYLQNIWCTKQGCNTCVTCRQIREKHYHHLLWITPEKQYTLEELEPLFETVSFDNSGEIPFFCVIGDAHLLTSACANKLLKTLEEPPTGYYFILLANQLQAVLPTIRSRCLITQEPRTSDTADHPLIPFFKETTREPLLFSQTLDTNTPNEYESTELVQQLLTYWYEKTLNNPAQINMRQIQVLHDALNQPPMAGSSKIFWRNLFIQWHSL